MDGSDAALHPRLRGDGAAALAAGWRDGGALRIDEVLAPGLAAELAAELPRLPLAARFDADRQDLSWSCEVAVPAARDPQYPDCLHRLADFLDRDLPALVAAITGRRLHPPGRGRVHVWALRKGSYVDAGAPLAPPGGVDVLLGLTGARWPAALGGHLELLGGDGAVVDVRPPGWDTLDLLDGVAYRFGLVRRHLDALLVRTWLAP